VVTGVATRDSIATATVRRAVELGAHVRVTAMERDHERAREIVHEWDRNIVVDALDLTDGAALAHWTSSLAASGRPVDGIVHAVAYAPKAALSGEFIATPSSDVEVAMRTSVWTYAALARALAELAPSSGAALVGLDFDAGGRAWRSITGWACARRRCERPLATSHATSGHEGFVAISWPPAP